MEVKDSFPEEDLKKYREEIKKNEVLLGMVLLRQHKAGALQSIVGSDAALWQVVLKLS